MVKNLIKLKQKKTKFSVPSDTVLFATFLGGSPWLGTFFKISTDIEDFILSVIYH